MKLYHFTSVSLSKAILSDCLSQGHLDTHTGKILEGVVWFTTLPFPEGTGVPTQVKELNERELVKAKKLEGELRNNLSSDKSRIRLSLDSQSLQSFALVNGLPEGLISFEKWCKLLGAPKAWVKYMGLSALHDLENMSDEKLRKLLKKKDSSKEHTWYLHFGPVSPDLITAVDYKVGRDYVTYDLNAHGREALAEAGIECVSADSIRDLEKIIAPSHQHELIHAVVICCEPSDRKIVFIRGSGNTCLVDIESNELVGLKS